MRYKSPMGKATYAYRASFAPAGADLWKRYSPRVALRLKACFTRGYMPLPLRGVRLEWQGRRHNMWDAWRVISGYAPSFPGRFDLDDAVGYALHCATLA